MTHAIFKTIDENGGMSDVHVVMGSLGAAIGTIAVATGKADECLRLTIDIARRIIDGSLLD